jgi:ABC-2 type transport system ATP-binding protein
MTMKLAVAAALSHRPKLLILDEATSGLDPIVRDDILDVFLDFVGDENNSILLSSHITSDLEKVADYITFIHDGRIIFSEQKDILKYNYGVMRCKAAQFAEIEKQDMLAYRKHDYQIDVLVADKDIAAKKYKDVVIDAVSIEEIMIMLVKGEK